MRKILKICFLIIKAKSFINVSLLVEDTAVSKTSITETSIISLRLSSGLHLNEVFIKFGNYCYTIKSTILTSNIGPPQAAHIGENSC